MISWIKDIFSPKTHVTINSVSSLEDGITIRNYKKGDQIVIEITGDVESIESDISVNINGNVKGNIVSSKAVNCGNVDGAINAISVNCGNIQSKNKTRIGWASKKPEKAVDEYPDWDYNFVEDEKVEDETL